MIPFFLYSYCSGRRFVCSTNECDGVCSIYGDGHYISFDEKRFEFSGQCEYTLVQVRWQMDVMLLFSNITLVWCPLSAFFDIVFVRTTVVTMIKLAASGLLLRMYSVGETSLAQSP